MPIKSCGKVDSTFRAYLRLRCQGNRDLEEIASYTIDKVILAYSLYKIWTDRSIAEHEQ